MYAYKQLQAGAATYCVEPSPSFQQPNRTIILNIPNTHDNNDNDNDNNIIIT